MEVEGWRGGSLASLRSMPRAAGAWAVGSLAASGNLEPPVHRVGPCAHPPTAPHPTPLHRHVQVMLGTQALIGVGTLAMGNAVATTAIVRERSMSS